MVSMLSASQVDNESEIRSCQNKDYKIVICCFSAYHEVLRSKKKHGWFRIRIMRPSKATCLSAGCCFSELAL